MKKATKCEGSFLVQKLLVKYERSFYGKSVAMHNAVYQLNN
jgi:hypothetical protein